MNRWCPGCPPPPCLTTCPPEWAIAFRTSRVLPVSQEFQYVGDLTRGFATLHEARGTSNSRLRAEALEYFRSAVRALYGASVTVKQVGQLDRANGVLQPVSAPWLTAAAIDVTDGLRELAGGGGQVPPSPSAAMAQFDEAYREFVLQVPIGN
ncbi:hypothetical protein ACFYY8_11275 [Streptosporangium sp. NPDC001559]|uniref:hypothetical protein n=1 Tax=unclassified Streptosporangium TaxID=2632669 RepID=UPI0036E3E799